MIIRKSESFLLRYYTSQLLNEFEFFKLCSGLVSREYFIFSHIGIFYLKVFLLQNLSLMFEGISHTNKFSLFKFHIANCRKLHRNHSKQFCMAFSTCRLAIWALLALSLQFWHLKYMIKWLEFYVFFPVTEQSRCQNLPWDCRFHKYKQTGFELALPAK